MEQNSRTKQRIKWVLSVVGCFVGALVVQGLLWRLCVCVSDRIYGFFPEFSQRRNIIEHTLTFLIPCALTLIWQISKGWDFGYRLFKIDRHILKCLCAIVGIALTLSLVEALFLIKMPVNTDLFWYMVFQFFFSGLGEEIVFRSIPIFVFDRLVAGDERYVQIKKIKIDLSVVLSSVLFSLVHINVYSNNSWWAMLYAIGFVFFWGIIFGLVYRKTRSVWACMMVHGLTNVLSAVFPIISGLLFGI